MAHQIRWVENEAEELKVRELQFLWSRSSPGHLLRACDIMATLPGPPRFLALGFLVNRMSMSLAAKTIDQAIWLLRPEAVKNKGVSRDAVATVAFAMRRIAMLFAAFMILDCTYMHSVDDLTSKNRQEYGCTMIECFDGDRKSMGTVTLGVWMQTTKTAAESNELSLRAFK